MMFEVKYSSGERVVFLSKGGDSGIGVKERYKILGLSGAAFLCCIVADGLIFFI